MCVSCSLSYLGCFIPCCNETQPMATTRKSTALVDRQNSEISYYTDDEDGNRKKYSRRGELKSLGSISHSDL